MRPHVILATIFLTPYRTWSEKTVDKCLFLDACPFVTTLIQPFSAERSRRLA